MQILSDNRCIIGEGPIWNEFNKKIYQVNAFANEIIEIDIYTKESKIRKLPFSVAAISFTKKGEKLVSCLDGVFILNDDNSRIPMYDNVICDIKYCNDAKVGPDGRFYVGTQSSKRLGVSNKIDGKLYSVDENGEVKILLDNLILSNGFDWSMDEKRFYHTDSDTKIIREYNFDKEKGEIVYTGREVKVDGVDGLTIDKRDFLYVACWGKGYIAVVDTADMQVKEYIKVPAKIPASCGFAGDDMDILAITTASYKADMSKDANAGCTFLKKMKAGGRMPYLFGL